MDRIYFHISVFIVGIFCFSTVLYWFLQRLLKIKEDLPGPGKYSPHQPSSILFSNLSPFSSETHFPNPAMLHQLPYSFFSSNPVPSCTFESHIPSSTIPGHFSLPRFYGHEYSTSPDSSRSKNRISDPVDPMHHRCRDHECSYLPKYSVQIDPYGHLLFPSPAECPGIWDRPCAHFRCHSYRDPDNSYIPKLYSGPADHILAEHLMSGPDTDSSRKYVPLPDRDIYRGCPIPGLYSPYIPAGYDDSCFRGLAPLPCDRSARSRECPRQQGNPTSGSELSKCNTPTFPQPGDDDANDKSYDFGEKLYGFDSRAYGSDKYSLVATQSNERECVPDYCFEEFKGI